MNSIVKMSFQSLNSIFEHFVGFDSKIFWVRSADYTRQLYISPNYEKIWGQSCDNLKANPYSWPDFLLPDDFDKTSKITSMRASNDQSKTEVRNYYRIKGIKSKPTHIIDQSFNILTADGELTAIAGIAKVISEEDWVKEALEQQQLEKNDIISPIRNDIISAIDKELKLTAFKNQTDTSPKILIPGKYYIDIRDGVLCLTKREAECLYHLYNGGSAKTIGRILQLSPRTIEAHLDRVKQKAKCRTRLELISKIKDTDTLEGWEF